MPLHYLDWLGNPALKVANTAYLAFLQLIHLSIQWPATFSDLLHLQSQPTVTHPPTILQVALA